MPSGRSTTAATPKDLPAATPRGTCCRSSPDSTVLVLLAFVTPLATGARTAAALHAGPAALTWMLSAMSVGLAVALLTAGVLADDRAARRVFVAGLVVLGAASAVAAAAGHAGIVIAARLVEGVGGAAVLAGGLGMIAHAHPAGAARARAGAIWGAAVGAGTGLGGIVAVVLDGAEGSWRVTYAATAVVALVLAAPGRASAARVGGGAAPVRSTLPACVLLAAGMGALLAGLVESRSGTGWLWVALLVAGVALLGTLRGGAGPPAGTADRSRTSSGRAVSSPPPWVRSSPGSGWSASCSYTPTVLQRGLGASLGSVMVLMLVWSVVGTATAWLLRHGARGERRPAARRLARGQRGRARRARRLEPGASLWRLLPGIVVLGLGYGGANAALGREAIAMCRGRWPGWAAAPATRPATWGSALGVTLAALLANPAAAPAELLRGFDEAALGAAVLSAAGALLVALVGRTLVVRGR